MIDHNPQIPIVSFFVYLVGLSLFVVKQAFTAIWSFLLSSGVDQDLLETINDYTETLANVLMVISFLVVIAMNANTLKQKLFNKDRDP